MHRSSLGTRTENHTGYRHPIQLSYDTDDSRHCLYDMLAPDGGLLKLHASMIWSVPACTARPWTLGDCDRAKSKKTAHLFVCITKSLQELNQGTTEFLAMSFEAGGQGRVLYYIQRTTYSQITRSKQHYALTSRKAIHTGSLMGNAALTAARAARASGLESRF